MSRRPNFLDGCEAVDTLGDTTPGAFDALPMLQHPAIAEADDATRLPRGAWAICAAVLCAVLLLSHFFPWGFAPPLQ